MPGKVNPVVPEVVTFCLPRDGQRLRPLLLPRTPASFNSNAYEPVEGLAMIESQHLPSTPPSYSYQVR